MGKRNAEPDTETKTLRLRKHTVRRVEAYAEQHSLRPSFSQIAEAALNEWLDRNEPQLPKPKK